MFVPRADHEYTPDRMEGTNKHVSGTDATASR